MAAGPAGGRTGMAFADTGPGPGTPNGFSQWPDNGGREPLACCGQMVPYS